MSGLQHQVLHPTDLCSVWDTAWSYEAGSQEQNSPGTQHCPTAMLLAKALGTQHTSCSILFPAEKT